MIRTVGINVSYLRSAFGLATLIGVAMALPSLLTPEVLSSAGLTYALVCLLVMVIAAPVVARWRARQIEFCDLVNCLNFSYVLHFGLGAVIAANFGSRFLHALPGNSDYAYINYAVALSILGIISLYVAYFGKAGERFTRLFKSLPAVWNPTLVPLVSLAAIALGYAFRVGIMIYQGGSITGFLTGNKDDFLNNSDGTTYIAAFTGLATIGLIALLIDGRMLRQKVSMNLFWALLPLEMAFRFFSGSRSSLAFLLISLATVFYLTRERSQQQNRRYAVICGFALVVAAVLFPLTSSVRFLGSAADPLQIFENSPQLATVEGMSYFVGERFHGVESLALLANRIPEHMPYNYGKSLTDAMVAWIPRQVWPEKPTVSLARNFEMDVVPPGLFPSTAAVAPTIPGEYYWSFGVPGLIAGMFGVGLLLRALQNRLIRPIGNASAILVAGFMYATFIQGVEQDTGYLLTYGTVNYLIALGFCLILARGVKA